MIKIVQGDILQASEDIIGHQVNCMGVMGAGLAKQIRNKYPVVFTKYKELVDKQIDKKKLLGAIQVIDFPNGKVIINLFAQYNYGRSVVFTDYKALEKGLKSIYYTVTQTDLKGKSVALPYGIGCGLAGGDWKVVYKMIDEIFSDYEITLYKFQ
jgi:O-acetyl-ADP-ribose deacetylase (regulator of RNase III)